MRSSRARAPATCAALAVVGLLAATRPARAQEIELSGPLAGACVAISRRYVVPVPIESAFWVGGGVAAEPAQASPSVAIGGELTTGVHEFARGPAAGESGFDRQQRRSPWELRVGPWGQVVARGPGSLVEGGVTLHLGATDDHLTRVGSLLMFDLRGGVGYGAFVGGSSPEVSGTLAWGFRTVFERHT